MGRGKTLASKLEDVFLDLLRGDLEPSGSGSLVRESRTGLNNERLKNQRNSSSELRTKRSTYNTLVGVVHASHLGLKGCRGWLNEV